jgi:thiamine transporter ThiT
MRRARPGCCHELVIDWRPAVAVTFLSMTVDPFLGLRRLLLALVAFGIVSIATDLVFLEHYEDGLMLIPLGALALGLASLVASVVSAVPRTVRLFQIVMGVLIVTGLVGAVLHFRGSLEFQVDLDPTLSTAALFWKVMHMKAPPTLAPGAFVQLGLLGLASTYRHPALRSYIVPTSPGAAP